MSAEQQVSDMELQKLKSGGDGPQAKAQIPNPTLENMKEAAYSIYEQYLSEKVKLQCRRGSQSSSKSVFPVSQSIFVTKFCFVCVHLLSSHIVTQNSLL